MRPFSKTLSALVMAAALVSLAAILDSQPAPKEQVGPLANGGFLLNSGWKLDPAGKQVPLDTLPMATTLSPDGRYLLVLHCGYRPPSIAVLDAATGAAVSSTPVPDAWLGLAFAPHSNRVYVGGGARAAVFEFTFADGKLAAGRTFELGAGKPGPDDFVGDVAFSPDGRLLYAAELNRDTVAVVNPQSGMVIQRIRTGRRPYRILFHPDGKSFFVTHWADGTLGHYDVSSGGQLARVPIGAHPTDMVWRAGGNTEDVEGEPRWAARIFVAATNTNSVYAVGVSQDKELRVVEGINVSMTPRQPLGMSPSGLGLSADGHRLYVACSDANAVAVVDLAGDRSYVKGFIPAGWYPTAVRALPSGTLVVLNGKGVRSYPNPHGPNPARRPEPRHAGLADNEYVAHMQTGTASWIEPFTEGQLEKWTAAALADSPYRDSKLDEGSPLPHIEHVIYIVKENRTYDQVLGDMKEGNGDASLALFDENSTPNLHKLAREFVLLDNFYVNADVSADGHNWSTAAIAPDYVVKLWPNEYGGRGKEYDFEEQDPASLPPAGYLWTNASLAGRSIRNFGYMVDEKRGAPMGADQISKVRDPVLAKVTNWKFPGFDLNTPDVDRAKVFLQEFSGYEKSGNMPELIVMRLPNDHTSGTKPGALAPLAMAADNDYAVGLVVEAVSKSKFWTSTAIFVVEDDAQNGADHVDSHRSPAFVISSYVRRHRVDSTMYNTASVLRTMEFLLGVKPMTHFDAGARPMTSVFQPTPDATPYAAEKPRISLTTRNPADGPGAEASIHMDFEEADKNDDDELNDVLWRAIRRGDPPPPARSFFGK